MLASTFSLCQILSQVGFLSSVFWATSFWAVLDVAAMATDQASVNGMRLWLRMMVRGPSCLSDGWHGWLAGARGEETG